MKKRSCFALFALLPAMAAGADPLALWHAGERMGAIEEWRRAAVAGNSGAALYLGYIFKQGIGVPADDARAFHWYLRAAEDGSPAAQYEVALMFELGSGVAQDLGQATYWYRQAGTQACPAALTTGVMLGEP
ncbi:MAG: sel1 repeat family protein [Gammaproteobacteria bacterium]|nr:sel1 repeat family protein [Gammaproteobacteria bacterium]